MGERRQAKEYMKWLFQQLEGPVWVEGWEDRKDCTAIDIPSDCVGYITGARRATLGALEEESGVETKSPGNFTRGLREKTSDYSGFDTDRLIFKDDELSYALGKQGATRKKLERAAHAILEYVGHIAFIAGTRKERKRAREYVDWLLAQRRGAVTIADVAGRDDATEIH